MPRHRIVFRSAVSCLLATITGVAAGETITYSYDALGRLVGSSISGGPSNTVATQACFDRAGNRSNYATGTTAPGACPTPAPTPTPSPEPPPPVPMTVADEGTVRTCRGVTIDVVANDSDPGGNTPLTVVATTNGQYAQPSIVGPTSVRYAGASVAGGDIFTYTVRNTLGLTATGTVNVTIVDEGDCN